MTPKPVAVLLAVYRDDDPDRFRRALASLRSQTYPSEAIRVYLGIDGPIGAPLEEAIEGAAGIHKIVRNETNIGLTKTLNKLIRALEDEDYVFRMDADDEALPDRFAMQMEFLDAHPQVDIVGGGVIEVDETGRELFVRRYPTDSEEIRRYICTANPLAHPTVCFRRRFFEQIPGYPERHRKNQDLALWFLALEHGIRVSNVQEPVVRRLHASDFYHRRGRRMAFAECSIYLKGIWRLHGLTWRYVYPLARLAFRLMPVWLTEAVYKGKVRGRLNRAMW